MQQVMLVYATYMFHLFVSNSTSFVSLWFDRATTSSLPLTAWPSPSTHVKPRSSWPPPLQASAGHLEAACHPFLYYLSHIASLCSSPSARRHRHREPLELQFALHTPPLPNSICHHVHIITTHRSRPLALFLIGHITPVLLSSLGPTGDAAVSALSWPGNLGSPRCHLSHVLCSF
jgi:hypothetical protein